MTAKEVSIGVGIDRNSASRKLNKLAKFKFVKKIATHVRIRTQDHKQFKYKLVR